MEMCYYSVLGICKHASDAEIRGAYRKLALEFDKFMQEMISMIESEKSKEERSLEDLQRLFMEMMDRDEILKSHLELNKSHQEASKRRRMTTR
ncbi:hypothetical protein C2S51_029611 [Perilla frutescens var. frutescens]|nr:hypothetical protein C2S51_029611 [Perilla frutescens var. frutescens]